MATEREIFLLKKELSYHIKRYLIVNSYRRLDGSEKAERHIEISKILVGFITCDETLERDNFLWRKVHDYLGDILTDRMDEVIGFPIDKPLYGGDYQLLEKKFFDVIVQNLDKIESIIKDKVC